MNPKLVSIKTKSGDDLTPMRLQPLSISQRKAIQGSMCARYDPTYRNMATRRERILPEHKAAMGISPIVLELMIGVALAACVFGFIMLF